MALLEYIPGLMIDPEVGPSPEEMVKIRAHFARRGRPVPDLVEQQAKAFAEGRSTGFSNPNLIRKPTQEAIQDALQDEDIPERPTTESIIDETTKRTEALRPASRSEGTSGFTGIDPRDEKAPEDPEFARKLADSWLTHPDVIAGKTRLPQWVIDYAESTPGRTVPEKARGPLGSERENRLQAEDAATAASEREEEARLQGVENDRRAVGVTAIAFVNDELRQGTPAASFEERVAKLSETIYGSTTPTEDQVSFLRANLETQDAQTAATGPAERLAQAGLKLAPGAKFDVGLTERDRPVGAETATLPDRSTRPAFDKAVGEQPSGDLALDTTRDRPLTAPTAEAPLASTGMADTEQLAEGSQEVRELATEQVAPSLRETSQAAAGVTGAVTQEVAAAPIAGTGGTDIPVPEIPEIPDFTVPTGGELPVRERPVTGDPGQITAPEAPGVGDFAVPDQLALPGLEDIDRPKPVLFETPEQGDVPTLDSPEFDQAAVDARTGEIAAPDIRRLRNAVQSAIASGDQNPNVRRMTLRDALEGFGVGLSAIKSGARTQANKELTERFRIKSDEAKTIFAAKTQAVRDKFSADVTAGTFNATALNNALTQEFDSANRQSEVEYVNEVQAVRDKFSAELAAGGAKFEAGESRKSQEYQTLLRVAETNLAARTKANSEQFQADQLAIRDEFQAAVQSQQQNIQNLLVGEGATFDARFASVMAEFNRGFDRLLSGEAQQFQAGERVAGQEFVSGEAELGREQQTAERVGTQAFVSGESELGRAQQTSERAARETFASFENVLGRDFAGTEAEKGRVFSALQDAIDREFQSGERNADRVFKAVEGALGREFTSEENQGNRLFNSIENSLSREYQSSEAVLNRIQQSTERVARETFASFENELSRAFSGTEAEKTRVNSALQSELNRQFQAGERDTDRILQAAESALGREFSTDENEKQRIFNSIESALNRKESKDNSALMIKIESLQRQIELESQKGVTPGSAAELNQRERLRHMNNEFDQLIKELEGV